MADEVGSSLDAAVLPKVEPCSSPGPRNCSLPPAGALVIDLDSEDEQTTPMKDLRPVGTSKRPADGVLAKPPSKKRKGSDPPRKTIALEENLPRNRKELKELQERERAQRENAGTGRARQVESSEGSQSAAISTCEPQLPKETNHRGQSAATGVPRSLTLDATPPMRAGVNVSAFYPTLSRVVTEYVDNAVAASLRMVHKGGIKQGYLWVNYERQTLTIRDRGPGMTEEAFEKAIKPSGTGRGLLEWKDIRDAVKPLKGPAGRNSMSSASGQYGYGLFAGFSVADRITIKTRPPNGSTMKAELVKTDWDTENTDWKIKVDILKDTTNEHGTEVILSLREGYGASKERIEEMRAALCAVCSPFADSENGLPSTLPPLFDEKLRQAELLDRSLEEPFRASRKQPVIVNFNGAELFKDPKERMVNLEVALNMTSCNTEGHRLVRIPLTPLLEKTALVCIGTIHTTFGRPAIPNYAELFPDMFQVVWQHRGGISGYTPRHLKSLPGRDRLRGIIFLGEYYRPMPPKDKISEECPLWPSLTKALDESLRKILEPLLQHCQQFDSNVSFEDLEKEVKGTKYFKKAVITASGGTTVLTLKSTLKIPHMVTNMVWLRRLYELPSGERRARVSLLTCTSVRKDVIDITVDELMGAKVKRPKEIKAYRQILPSKVTCAVLGKPSGPFGSLNLAVTVRGKHAERIHMPEPLDVQILCNGTELHTERLESHTGKVSVPVLAKAGPAQYGVAIDGWDITPDLKNEKARVIVPAGPPEKPVVRVEPRKVVRSGEEITLRVSFKDTTGEDQAKLPRALEIDAVVRGKQSAKNRNTAPSLHLEKQWKTDKDGRTAMLKGRLEGRKQKASLIVEIKWKGEKAMKEKIVHPLELTEGRPTELRIVSPQDLVVENGAELEGLTFGLSDGHNTLSDASEVTLTSDDVSFDGRSERKVRAGQSVRISCLEGGGVASEDGTKECKVTATYKEKGKDGQVLDLEFYLKVLPGNLPTKLGFEAPEKAVDVRSGETFFAEGQLRAFVLGETGGKLETKYASAFTVRWKPIGRKSTRGGSSPAKPTPLVKAAGFSDQSGTVVLFPAILAPLVVEEYDLVLEVEDKLSDPQLQLSEMVAPKVAVLAGPPAKMGMHGGPRKEQPFNADKCYLPECSIFTIDGSGNKCKDLTEELPVRIRLLPNAENPNATAPSVELPEQDLLLGPLQADLALKRVKLNQDGSTGFYDLTVEADGLEAISTAIFYTNNRELAEAADEEKQLQDQKQSNKAAISKLEIKLSEIEEDVEESEKKIEELSQRLEGFRDEVTKAMETYQGFAHHLAGVLPQGFPPLTESSVEDACINIEYQIHQERSALQPLQLGGGRWGHILRKVQMLANHLRNQGVLGYLGELASAEDPRVCAALASLVLGPEKLCWLIVRDLIAKQKCVDFLRARGESWNDVPFLRLDGFNKPHSYGPDPRATGCLGYAKNLVKIDPRLSSEAQEAVKGVVLNACRDALLFETGAQAMEYKAFLLSQRGNMRRMLSLDGHRLESNEVEYEGSGADARMDFSLAQCDSERLLQLRGMKAALGQLRDLQERCRRAQTAHERRSAPGGEVQQLEAEIAELKRQNVEPEDEIKKLNEELKELRQEQRQIAKELQSLQAAMKKTASPQSAAKTTAPPSAMKKPTPKRRSGYR